MILSQALHILFGTLVGLLGCISAPVAQAKNDGLDNNNDNSRKVTLILISTTMIAVVAASGLK